MNPLACLLPSLCVCLVWLAQPADAATSTAAETTFLPELTVLALDPAAQGAVVKVADGDLLLLVAGDLLPGEAIKVRRVLADRLVLSERLPSGVQRLAWLYLIDPDSGRSQLRYLDRLPADNSLQLSPATPDLGTEDRR